MAQKAQRRDVPDDELRALVHVAGPVEREPYDLPLGYAWTQRCLRCDELLAIWKSAAAPSRSFTPGKLIALDPYTGIAGMRREVAEIGPRDRACSSLPVALA
jgi:hypothetical protein